jgi:hypothetical protein
MVKGQANALPLVLLLIKGYRVRLLARLPSPPFMQRPAHAASIRGRREHCQDMRRKVDGQDCGFQLNRNW